LVFLDYLEKLVQLVQQDLRVRWVHLVMKDLEENVDLLDLLDRVERLVLEENLALRVFLAKMANQVSLVDLESAVPLAHLEIREIQDSLVCKDYVDRQVQLEELERGEKLDLKVFLEIKVQLVLLVRLVQQE
jgi:hypothetical protein